MTALFCPESGMLSNGTLQIMLTDQIKRGLIFFCQNEGVLVTRQEFTRVCWESRGLVVTDATVRQTVYRLRRLFREVALQENVLETRGKTGYFLAPGHICLQAAVSVQPQSTALAEECDRITPPETPRWALWRLLAVCVLCGVIAAVAGACLRSRDFITPLEYRHAVTQHDRHFYLASTVPDNAPDVLARVERWLTWDDVRLSDSRYVYINGVLESYVSALVCDSPVALVSSRCHTLTILGDNHW